MGRQKKSEIDAILEQLKISYFDDSQSEREDSLQETVEVEEDAELTAILEQIFGDVEEADGETSRPAEQFVEEAKSDEVSVHSEHTLSLDNESLKEDTDKQRELNEECSTRDDDIVSQVVAQEDVLSEDEYVKSEQERVDDVLKSMFHSELISPPASESAEIVDQNYDIEPDIQEREESTELPVQTLIDYDADTVCLALENSTTDGYEMSGLVCDEEEAQDFQAKISEIFDDAEIIEPESDETIYDIPKAKLILNPDDYVQDDMQHSLGEIPFFKPQNDINFSIREYVRESDNKSDESYVAGGQPSDPKSEMSDKEIALLMKLGYNGEINASGENQHAHKVIFDESKNYVPDKHKIIHGFCGKEFSSKEQIPDIKRKFKYDRIKILVQSIVVSLLAIVMTVFDFAAVFSDVKYNFLVTLCLLSSLITFAVMYKQILAGISAIFKFDTNQYSLPSVILIENIICSIIIGCVMSAKFDLIGSETYFSVGGYPLLYMAITAWSEWIDCYRESCIFNLISDDNTRFVAEKRTSTNFVKESNRRRASFSEESGNRYIVKRAKFISGFHHKTCDSKLKGSKIFLSIGIIPASAIIMGIIISVFNDSFVPGLSGMTFILFMSAPVCYVASLSVMELLTYLRLKKSNSVLIGSEAATSISNAKSLVFQDIDAIQITACTKINPNKNSENPQKWLNIAKRVFETLGGPLSKIHAQDKDNMSNISHDVAINSISDNGIDLYFDSSMNILIGDRSYMQSHNIKVKTDVNLTGATRGAERSVIYMAFDRTPQIGFIITSKVKKSFLKIIYLLTNNNINIEVQSYEPQINEYFFEVNNPDSPVSVFKPLTYESLEPSEVSNGELVSSSPLDVCRAIIYSKIVARDIDKIKKNARIQTVLGMATSVLLGILLCLPSKVRFIGILQENSSVLFYLIALAMIIPNIVHILKVLKRK